MLALLSQYPPSKPPTFLTHTPPPLAMTGANGHSLGGVRLLCAGRGGNLSPRAVGSGPDEGAVASWALAGVTRNSDSFSRTRASGGHSKPSPPCCGG